MKNDDWYVCCDSASEHNYHIQITELQAREKILVEAIDKVIDMNIQTAHAQYGDKTKAESWSCVKVLRSALAELNKKTGE